MTNQQHPITPPPELVEQWANVSAQTNKENGTYAQHEFALATQAARWGADQELEACCEWVNDDLAYDVADRLRTARRPKPPSLKEQALSSLDEVIECLKVLTSNASVDGPAIATIRRALEQLDD